jgi:hypothetical protein
MTKSEKPYYKKYHSPAGEAARLRAIMDIYAGDPEAVARAKATLDKHLAEHPEVVPMTDDEKHAFCKERTGFHAVFLTQAMYDAGEHAGADMRYYVVQKPMATHGERLTIEHKLPTGEEMRAEMQRKLDAGELLGAFHNAEITKGGPVYANGCLTNADGSEYKRGPIEYSKLAPSDKPRWTDCGGFTRRGGPVRKRVSTKTCGGDTLCLPGLGGKCVACSDEA